MNEFNRELDEVGRILASLDELGEDKVRSMLSDAKAMIGYYIGLIDQIEERRNKYYEFTLLYITALLTGLALLYSARSGLGRDLVVGVAGVLIVQLAFSVYAAVAYALQSRFHYPFLDVEDYSNQWKWFYYGNKQILGLSTRVFFPPRRAESTTLPYLKGLHEFVELELPRFR